MNWTAITALLKTDWVRKRATNDLLLLSIVLFAGHFVLNVNPKQQEATRQAWKDSKAAGEKILVEALQKQEDQQGKQIERVSESFDKAAATFKESHKEAIDLFREFRRAASAAADGGLSANVSAEPVDVEDDP